MHSGVLLWRELNGVAKSWSKRDFPKRVVSRSSNFRVGELTATTATGFVIRDMTSNPRLAAASFVCNVSGSTTGNLQAPQLWHGTHQIRGITVATSSFSWNGLLVNLIVLPGEFACLVTFLELLFVWLQSKFDVYDHILALKDSKPDCRNWFMGSTVGIIIHGWDYYPRRP